VEADGTALPDGEQGVIEVRLPGMSSGYFGRPGDPAFHDGWYRTGDLGYLDADSYLHVRGRAADARDVGGVTVLPLDLEEAACDHPDVVYAVALPAEPGPDGPFGVLALRARGSSVEAADVRAHLERQVEPPAAVGDVVLVDHLPVTEQGKPDRSIIGELLRR
jgi:fatty-acyl-CoA synthase